MVQIRAILALVRQHKVEFDGFKEKRRNDESVMMVYLFISRHECI